MENSGHKEQDRPYNRGAHAVLEDLAREAGPWRKDGVRMKLDHGGPCRRF